MRRELQCQEKMDASTPKGKDLGFSLSGENHNTDRKCQSAVNLSGKEREGRLLCSGCLF